MLKEKSIFVDNGIHEIYVNTQVTDDTVTSQLMQYFLNSNGYNPNFKKISQRVLHLKESNEGVREMASVFDEYAEEVSAKRIKDYDKEKDRKTAILCLKKGASIDFVSEIAPSLSRADIQQLKNKLENELSSVS